jgi:hypothetical protein
VPLELHSSSLTPTTNPVDTIVYLSRGATRLAAAPPIAAWGQREADAPPPPDTEGGRGAATTCERGLEGSLLHHVLHAAARWKRERVTPLVNSVVPPARATLVQVRSTLPHPRSGYIAWARPSIRPSKLAPEEGNPNSSPDHLSAISPRKERKALVWKES